MSNQKQELKHILKIYVDEKRIRTKPYILNTFGNICYGILTELSNIEIKEQFLFEIFTGEGEGNKVSITQDLNKLTLKPYVQDMILKTLVGFISSLGDIPDNLNQAKIKIEYQKK